MLAGYGGALVLSVGMALYGVVYAVLENDARRLLAYHIISQVGYMVWQPGIALPHRGQPMFCRTIRMAACCLWAAARCCR